MFSFLFLQRTRVDDTDMYGRTALHIACSMRKAEAVKALLQKQSAFVKDKQGRDPLEYSKQKGYHEIVSILEDFAQNTNGGKPATRAVMPNVNMSTIPPAEFWKHAKEAINQGAHEVLDTMLQVAIKAKPFLVDMGMGDNQVEGRTLLHYACQKKQPACVSVLLRHGFSANVMGLIHKETPLHLAAAASSVECLRLLLENEVHNLCFLDIPQAHHAP
jgi:ankyrin repeat protein